MRKTVYRSITVVELRRLLEKFEDRARLQVIPVGVVPGEKVTFAISAGELLEFIAGEEDDEQIGLDGWAVIGFICTDPPSLCLSRTSESIQSN
jgi:hypothetical protein